MKIIGGNFGVNGSVALKGENVLVVNGSQVRAYEPTQIISVTASIVKERKFRILVFAFLAIFLSVLLSFVLSFLGFLIGFTIAVVSSFYFKKINVVEIVFNDEKFVAVACTPKDVNLLSQFASSAE